MSLARTRSFLEAGISGRVRRSVRFFAPFLRPPDRGRASHFFGQAFSDSTHFPTRPRGLSTRRRALPSTLRFLAAALVFASLFSSRPGRAQQDTKGPEPSSAPPSAPATPAPPNAAPESQNAAQAPAQQQSVEDLQKRVDELEDQVGELRDDLDNATQVAAERDRSTVDVHGYIDVGFFYVNGNGAGTRPDIGHRYLPQYSAVSDSWVFMGDPLSTAINSRGEPADTGESRAIVFDPIKAGNHPTFIVNSVGLDLSASPLDTIFAEALVDFVPRSRNPSDPDGVFLGDYIDVKLAFARYSPHVEPFGLEFYAGKIESVLGVEYRAQDAPDRLTVTPSLICRYTCGRPIGLKARGWLPSQALVLNMAVTNGSSMVELFPFYDETDSNSPKTYSGRLSSVLWPEGGLEVGVSGLYGAQDLQPDSDVKQWHFGADLRLDWNRFVAMGEFVRGKAEGKTTPGNPTDCDIAPCIDYRGAYGLVGVRTTSWLTPYLRVDWRDATHKSGDSFVYVSKLARGTIGANVRIGSNVIVKAEYTFDHELPPIPQFDNDIFTSSLVLKL